jgi:hypothetical protein
MVETKPNFFVVGAMRSGTTSIHQYLRIHPKIFIPHHKEPEFFCEFQNTQLLGENPTLKNYLKLFEEVKNEIVVGEVSPDYLFDPESAQKIYNFNPNSKIIMILRNPIERAFSHFLHTKFKWEKISFYEKIVNDSKKDFGTKLDQDNVLMYGMYFNQVKKYLDIFGTENVKVIIYDEMFPNNIDEKMSEILFFLGLGKELHDFSREKYNSYYTPRKKIEKIITSKFFKKLGYLLLSERKRKNLLSKIREKSVEKPKISNKEREFLKEFFNNDIENLKKLLNKKISWLSDFQA